MLHISPSVRQKLKVKHGVTQPEIEQCFANREGKFLLDLREKHQSDPPTKWFIAQTDYGRRLKVAFIQATNGTITIRSAFEPNPDEIYIYEKYGQIGRTPSP